MGSALNDDWTGRGKVRAREADGTLTLVVEGLTTQAKYYKPLIYEFFRKEWRGARPAWGDFSVEILMGNTGDPPRVWLRNHAKAVLHAIKGHPLHDNAHGAPPVVEHRGGERERITMAGCRVRLQLP